MITQTELTEKLKICACVEIHDYTNNKHNHVLNMWGKYWLRPEDNAKFFVEGLSQYLYGCMKQTNVVVRIELWGKDVEVLFDGRRKNV